MQRARRLFSRSTYRGQTLVLFALMSLTLIAGLGLVIDAGVNYAQRRNMQNAADTAALAGTRIVSRINSFPGTTRGMVWAAVKSTAVENGVANNATLFQCEFVDTSSQPMGVSCNTDVDGDTNVIIPRETAGVQVRVSETHGTFFMRAVGIRTSGTSAAARAQVRAMTFMLTNDVTFAVCGLDTTTRGPLEAPGRDDILKYGWVDDWTQEPPLPSPSPYPQKKIATLENTAIREEAYRFDWNKRNPLFPDQMAQDEQLPGPTFHIYSSSIATCDEKNGGWRGAIQQRADDDIQMDRDGGRAFAPTVNLRAGNVMSGVPYSSPNCKKASQSDFCIEHAINGTLGCKVGQFPAPLDPLLYEPRLSRLSTDGCIMILPIVDNGYKFTTGGVGIPPDSRGSLTGRVWGAFYVFNKNGNYYGWLIKNYPVHEDGQDTWTWDYVGPITVALTKVEE